MIKKAIFLFIFLLSFFCFSTAKAEVQKEEILSYHIDATLNQDSSVLVQETIKVRAQGRDIKRGIYRDFPLKHAGGKTPVSIISVTRDGTDIPYSTQMQNGQKRVYLGDMNKYISSGVYEYKITYKYQNIIRQNNEKTKDEFYYNLIGNEWMFDILEATAVVHLPKELKLIETPKVFAGKYGSKNQVSFSEQDNQISIHLPSGLKKQEALTLRTVFNSGFFKIPEFGLFPIKKWNNFCMLIVFISFLSLGVYAYLSWKKYGKDGMKKPAYPRFDIPKFKELGSLYLLWNFRGVCVDSVQLIMPHLAYLSQKGLLKIKVDKDAVVLEKNEKISPKNEDEKFFYSNCKKSYCLKKYKYNSSFTRYVKAYDKYARKTVKKLVKRNSKKMRLFAMWMFFNCVGFFLLYFKSIASLIESIALSTSIFAFSFIILELFERKHEWRQHICGMCFIMGFGVLFFVCILGGAYSDFLGHHVVTMEEILGNIFDVKTILLTLLFSCCVAFYRYTIFRIYDKWLGLIEHLEGIKMFLNGVDDLKHQTPEQAEMEKLLPYAILLGMHNKWCEKMETYFNFTPPENDVFSNAVVFSSLNSSLQLSTEKPSSSGGSSGFSEGGCSGGGGGGGGCGGF